MIPKAITKSNAATKSERSDYRDIFRFDVRLSIKAETLLICCRVGIRLPKVTAAEAAEVERVTLRGDGRHQRFDNDRMRRLLAI